MDGVTAAVAIMGGQMAMTRVDAIAKMVKHNQEVSQGIVDLVASSAGSGTVYSPAGSVQAVDVGSKLNTQA